MITDQDTIVAIATGQGGAIAVIRLSGPQVFEVGDAIFQSKSGEKLASQKGYTLHYGSIQDQNHHPVDDVLISVFHAPYSYTGEDMLEISCHASPYIQQEILRLCQHQGARAARPGEFTLRAFLNGKMDLAQAEAVADIIAANSRAAHELATRQIRGGYSEEFSRLRAQLLELVSLLELELDFSEEDVEFADRNQIDNLMKTIYNKIYHLKSSFKLGNILKNGVPVAIVGSPNVGKSTLLNALVNEEKALVSDIAGTTRDVIEDAVNIDGVLYRFIDTAGIRETDDPLENLGIERTFQRLDQAAIVLLLIDAQESVEAMMPQLDTVDIRADQRIAVVLNKADRIDSEELAHKQQLLHEKTRYTVIGLSAKHRTNMNALLDFLKDSIHWESLREEEVIVFNARHHQILQEAESALLRARQSLADRLPGDLLAQDIREVLYHLNSITGTEEITSDDILKNIFSSFCVGK